MATRSPAQRLVAAAAGAASGAASVIPSLWLVLLLASITPSPGGTEGRRPQGVGEWAFDLGLAALLSVLVSALLVAGIGGLQVALRGRGLRRRSAARAILIVAAALLALFTLAALTAVER